MSRPTRTPRERAARLDAELTDRQRTALEVGYYAGFFDWPRESNGADLADLLDVTSSTVHHHLRNGERKLVAAFLEHAE